MGRRWLLLAERLLLVLIAWLLASYLPPAVVAGIWGK